MRVDNASLCSCSFLMHYATNLNRSVSKNSSLDFYNLVYCSIAFIVLYFTCTVGSAIRATKSLASSAVICYSYCYCCCVGGSAYLVRFSVVVCLVSGSIVCIRLTILVIFQQCIIILLIEIIPGESFIKSGLSLLSSPRFPLCST